MRVSCKCVSESSDIQILLPTRDVSVRTLCRATVLAGRLPSRPTLAELGELLGAVPLSPPSSQPSIRFGLFTFSRPPNLAYHISIRYHEYSKNSFSPAQAVRRLALSPHLQVQHIPRRHPSHEWRHPYAIHHRSNSTLASASV